MAASLGLRLKAVVAYNEYEGNDYPIIYNNAANVRAVADVAGAFSGNGPDSIAAGSKEVAMNVSVTYEIVPVIAPRDRW